MKKVSAILIVTMLIFSMMIFSGYGKSNSQVPDEVLNVAHNGLEMIKGKMLGEPQKWGFDDTEDVKRAVLGQGYRINYISHEKLDKSSGKSLMEAKDTNKIEMWEFIISVDETPKTLLTVGFEDGEYRIVRYGGNTLAQELGTALGNFKKFAKEKGSIVEPELVEAANVYYLCGEIDNEEFVLPALSKANSKKLTGKDEMNYTKLKPASEVIQHIKDYSK